MRAIFLTLAPIAAVALFLASRRDASASIDVPAVADGAGELLSGFDFSDALDSVGSSIELAGTSIVQGLQSGVEQVSETTRKIFTLPAAGEPYAGTIARAEEQYGIPSSLLGRVLYQESRFRPDIIDGTKRSSTGATGIAQFMPATANDLGVDPLNTSSAIDGAARYLRSLYDQLGTWTKALAAYNWGIGNVQRKGLAAAPAETQKYVTAILNDVEV